MRRAEIITAAVLLALALAVMVEAVRLGPGWGDSGPKAGFFPFYLSLILGLGSLWVLVQALRAGGGGSRPFFPPRALRLVLTVLLPMAVAIGLIELVGFYIASLFYLFAYIRLTGRQSWSVTVGVSVLFPFLTFLIFERWFLIPLPKGLFGEQLLPF